MCMREIFWDFFNEIHFPIISHEESLYEILEETYHKVRSATTRLSESAKKIVMESKMKEHMDKILSLCSQSEDAEEKWFALFNSIEWFSLNFNNDILHWCKVRKDEEKSFGWRDLYYIPAKEKDKATLNRFSSAGEPALYLAGNLPIAWSEITYPQVFWVSWYSLGDIKKPALYLMSPKEFKQDYLEPKLPFDESSVASVKEYLSALPVILACAVRKNDDAKDRNEYFISLKLSKWVAKGDKYSGIVYWTTLNSCFAVKDGHRKHNAVFPLENEEMDFEKYDELNNLIKISSPQKFEIRTVLNMDTLTQEMILNAKKEISKLIPNEQPSTIDLLCCSLRKFEFLVETLYRDITDETLIIIQLIYEYLNAMGRHLKSKNVETTKMTNLNILLEVLGKIVTSSSIMNTEKEYGCDLITVSERLKSENEHEQPTND